MLWDNIFLFFKKNWGVFFLSFILLFIIVVNFKPGFFILGNDNFTPELNPSLALQRSFFSAAWRTYRALGVASDSEQADIFRSLLFLILGKWLPGWFVSQGYLFFTFFIGIYSMASFVRLIVCRIYAGKLNQQLAFFFGGLFYLSSMLTSWIYFFPVQLFVAAYAFLPFVLWRLYVFYEKQSYKNTLLLFLAALFLSTVAITATMYFICFVVLAFYSFLFFFDTHKRRGFIKAAPPLFFGFWIVVAIQSFWILPFFTYIKSNTKPIRDSAIYREITTTTIENEAKHNTLFNSIRYFASWMDTKEDRSNYTFVYRDFYKSNILGGILSFIPFVFSCFGSFYVIKNRKNKLFYTIPVLTIIGWFAIKGINPPFGQIFSWFQKYHPILAQVFRWQSSKLWPFLGMTIPILATLGVLVLYSFLKKRTIKHPRWVVIFIACVSLSLLLFVFPYFKGDLIRKSEFIKVPNEYFELSAYLQKNDQFSRIYPAPEANTLYFRNYAWGFWGSVVLHYILPNPLMEKALVIGSQESEDAFFAIRNAYYSSDPTYFALLLKRYNTPFVLSDKSVWQGATGYAYNWSVHKKVVEESSQLEKVWHKGNLTLYKLKNYPTSEKAVQVSSQTDFAKLNRLLSYIGDTKPYFSKEKEEGIIYPFALTFDAITFSDNEMIGKIENLGKDQTYTFTLDQDKFDNAPTQVSYSSETKQIELFPVLPYLEINNTVYRYDLPITKYTVQSQPLFIAYNNQLIDQREGQARLKTVNTFYKDITDTSQIRAWVGAYTPTDLLSGEKKSILYCNDDLYRVLVFVSKGTKAKCGTDLIPFAQDTVAEIELGIQTSAPTRVVLCVYSTFKQGCLNTNTTAFINGSSESTLLIPKAISAGENLKVYLDFEALQTDSEVSIKKIVLNKYETSEAPQPLETTKAKPYAHELVIKKNDTIAFHIPIVRGSNTWQLKAEGDFLAETTLHAFEAKGLKQSVFVDLAEVHITTNEGNGNIFPKLPFVEPQGGLGLIGISGENISGIPAEVSLQDEAFSYKIWQRMLFPSQKTQTLDLFLLPNEVKSYFLETFVTALGPRKSENMLKAINFQIIPKAWASLVLVPKQQNELSINTLSEAFSYETNIYSGTSKSSNPLIVALPTSQSTFWQLLSMEWGQKVLVNGWQQAWKVGKGSNFASFYVPNLLVYIGFVPGMVVIVWLVGALVIRFVKKIIY